MDNLSDQAFEKILGYLSLQDVIKTRPVSRGWRDKVDRFRVNSLFYSELPSRFTYGKRRWVSGVFAQNSISTGRFEAFFNTFGPTILCNLKQLRLNELSLDAKNRNAFVQTLNSFGQLEKLELAGNPCHGFNPRVDLELQLPMLKSIHLVNYDRIRKLTLDAPRLQKVKILTCFSLKLDLVHAESVETLIADRLEYIIWPVPSIKYLYIGPYSKIDSTLLADLEQLKEVHLSEREKTLQIFEQKQQYGRADLKVYLCGLLVNNSTDVRETLYSADMLDKKGFDHLAKNVSRLADEIPFCHYLHYKAIEAVAPELATNVLSRFTDLNDITVDRPLDDIERFLNFLKNSNIVELKFGCYQEPDLFDRLPEHSAIQKLTIELAGVSDFEFLLRLEHLVCLKVYQRIDLESVRRILKGLKFLCYFAFDYGGGTLIVEIDQERLPQKQFFIRGNIATACLPNPDAVIQHITRRSAETAVENHLAAEMLYWQL